MDESMRQEGRPPLDALADEKKSAITVTSQEAWWRHAPLTTYRDVPAGPFADVLRRVGSLLVLGRADSVICCLSEVAGKVRITTVGVPGPMGLAYRDRRLAIGCAVDLRTYVNIGEPGAEEAVFLPTAVHLTGAVSVHDVAWGEGGALWFTNTLFSTICTVEPGGGFRHRWQPRFISTPPQAGDACHLNGMACDDEGVRYATALAATDTPEGWRADAPDAGVLLDAEGDVCSAELSLPHSPMIEGDAVYFLESGRGRVVRHHNGTQVLAELPAVTRGLALSDQALFVGTSPVRRTSGEVSSLLISRFPNAEVCALFALARDGRRIARLQLPFLSEISSVHLLPHRKVSFLRPDAVQRATTFVHMW